MSPSFEIIRTNLRRFILEGGYPSVERFAHENAIDKTTLSRILNGKREPRLSTLIKIAECLNLTLNDFYLDRDPATRRDAGVDGPVLSLLVPEAEARTLRAGLGSKRSLMLELKLPAEKAGYAGDASP